MALVALVEGGGTASCGCNTGALIPTLPPSSTSAFGAKSLPGASFQQATIPLVATVWSFWRSPLHSLAVPTSTVFDPSIDPKNLPCSFRESKGPRRRLDGCQGIHHTPHTSFVCCLAVSTNRKPTVHAGGIRRTPSQQIMVCKHLNTRSSPHRQLDRSDMPFDDVYLTFCNTVGLRVAFS